MPDLITHVALAHVIKRPFDLKKSHTPFRALLYLGTILPDVLSRPFYILFPNTYDQIVFFHTPVGMLLTISLLVLFFEPAIRKGAFINLTAGAGLHFLLDAFQIQTSGNNYWLFPFTYTNFGYGLFQAGDLIPFIPLWIGLVAAMEVGIYIGAKNRP